MPYISAFEPRITAAFTWIDPPGSRPFTQVGVTIDDGTELRLEYSGPYEVKPDVVRRQLVHGIDPGLEERVGELICKVIGAYQAGLAPPRGPDGEEHPADEALDDVRVDIIHALKELFHQEPAKPPRELVPEDALVAEPTVDIDIPDVPKF